MQYLCLIYSAESSGPQHGTPEFGPYMQSYMEFTAKVQEDGVFVAGEGLQPVMTASTVTMENGQPEITDGPFAETKEQLGGFYLLDCPDLDTALKYAAQIPTATHGRIEVRPVMVYD
ncbi:MAG: YciI family protein [Henriciella sp.]|nr:YciI family protein [Henriciella sp.]